jgi:hypothetical protein
VIGKTKISPLINADDTDLRGIPGVGFCKLFRILVGRIGGGVAPNSLSQTKGSYTYTNAYKSPCKINYKTSSRIVKILLANPRQNQKMGHQDVFKGTGLGVSACQTKY